MKELLNNPVALPALIAAVVSTVVTLVVNGARGLYRLYEVRRAARFARELELGVEGYIEVAPRGPLSEVGERLLHVRLNLHNSGGARVEIESATLKVSPRLLEEEIPGRSRELVFGDADIYEAFPGRVPGLVLIPGQSHPRSVAVEVPGTWSLPLKLRLEVRSGDDRW